MNRFLSTLVVLLRFALKPNRRLGFELKGLLVFPDVVITGRQLRPELHFAAVVVHRFAVEHSIDHDSPR